MAHVHYYAPITKVGDYQGQLVSILCPSQKRCILELCYYRMLTAYLKLEAKTTGKCARSG